MDILLFFKIYLKIFGCAESSLLHVGFFQLQQARATLHCDVWASHRDGFSCGTQVLAVWASVVAAHGLSSCEAQAQLLHGMQDLPGPGIKPVFLALADEFLITGTPGKPFLLIIFQRSQCKRMTHEVIKKKKSNFILTFSIPAPPHHPLLRGHYQYQ